MSRMSKRKKKYAEEKLCRPMPIYRAEELVIPVKQSSSGDDTRSLPFPNMPQASTGKYGC